MGLIDRIFKSSGGGNEKAREPAAERASTQFFESEPDAGDSQAGRNAPRRELVQVVLRDTMRKHGIPSDWIECRILSAVTRSGRRGMHVNFVVRQAHEQLIAHVFAFQDNFEREMARFEPRCRDWLLSVGWEFPGAKPAEMPPGSRPQAVRAAAASPATPAVSSSAARAADEAAAKSDDEIQNDLQALFAIRDAALADAARRPAGDEDHPEFQPTQPFDDEDRKPAPKR